MTRFCTRCVISTNRPIASREYSRVPGSEPGRMAFDEAGVCAACRVAEAKTTVDWGARRESLRELLAKYRRTDGRPDVLVPGSGGKDSVLAAHTLRQFGLHPLTVTWAPHAYTEVGWRNFHAWLAAGFDNLLVTPNPKVHRTLTRLAFTNLLHPFQPFILGQRSLAPKLAARLGIELVVFGEDDAEYEGEAGWQQKDEWLGSPEAYCIAGETYPALITKHGLAKYDLDLYMPAFAPQVVRIALGNYIRWDPEEAYYFAQQHGFQRNEERTEGTFTLFNSIDDRLDPLHYYTMFTKFGVGRASHDASMHIRNGRLTREEGVALVHQYDGEIRKESVQWYADYMSISVDEFWQTIWRFRKVYPQVQ